ncbi:tetratricopeptide repeat protein [Paraburkholderia sp.]|uniref:tetratricopeptide repeat protein n=1 Tax=Paraburkholderia sp. TaxID=1926495 RepID=UPI00239F44DE|nr:tetratricopeptide repeat protein [Paraburkholderia sp.]MDE1181188.1 tetratricopeptide repeat protein [Paraburkholderia sp.]
MDQTVSPRPDHAANSSHVAGPSSAVAAPNALLDAALDAHRSGDLDRADALYRDALAHNPSNADALHYYGVLHHQRGNARYAAHLMDDALAIFADDPACWSNRGLVAAALGQPDAAHAYYLRALRLQPAFADAHNNLGVLLQSQRLYDDAAHHYQSALDIDPSHIDAHLNLGTTLAKLERHDEALACYANALSLDPRSASAYFNAGNCFDDIGDADAAIVHFRRAIAIQPDFAEAHVNLGSVIGKRGDYAQAELHYRDALALKRSPTHLVCVGASLAAQGRVDDEEAFYRAALELDPGHADAHQNLAWALLRRGDYPEGWAAYAKRWRAQDYAHIAVAGVPEWHGESLDGKRLLLVGEQGFGDQLQFVRYASVLAERGAIVDVSVRAPLVELVATVPGVHRVFSGQPEGDAASQYDFWVSMMSVPSCVRTGLDTIPAALPYLSAQPDAVERWRERVTAVAPTQRKIGLVWAGSPTFGNDRYRSMPFDTLATLGDADATACFSLQKGAAGEPARLASAALKPHDFTADLHDFTDTAALIMNLDLVIAVDTGVAHLAAALGKPVWLMLPFNSDWRWLDGRSDSPWYPGMRVFRQTHLGDWTPVLADIRTILHTHDV